MGVLRETIVAAKGAIRSFVSGVAAERAASAGEAGIGCRCAWVRGIPILTGCGRVLNGHELPRSCVVSEIVYHLSQVGNRILESRPTSDEEVEQQSQTKESDV